jgi:hypothetical protein
LLRPGESLAADSATGDPGWNITDCATVGRAEEVRYVFELVAEQALYISVVSDLPVQVRSRAGGGETPSG